MNAMEIKTISLAPSTELVAELAAAAEAWRAWCQGSQASAGEEAPLAVLLLSAFAEPPHFDTRFSGDMIADLLGVLQGTVARWRSNIEGPSSIEAHELRQLDRRLDLLLELRRRSVAGGGR